MDLGQRKPGGVFMPGRVKLSAYMNYGLLTVHIVKGNKLSWKPAPSTFVMIALIPVDTNTTPTRCRTEIVKGSNCPEYDEKFSFEVSDEDLNKRLLISVFSRDSKKHHQESLGCMSFGLRHIKSGREVNGWYYLLSDDVGLHKHRHVIVKERPPLPRKLESTAVPAINQDVEGLVKKEIAVSRTRYGEFGFTLVESCPVRVGRVDLGSHAEEAGLQKGDAVVRVNGLNVSRSTSISVAKMVKKSGHQVYLEIHRANQSVPVAMETFDQTLKGYNSVDYMSVQEFTICDEKAALLESAISIDTRRQAALHRLLCLEENFVDLMNVGIQRFSRPLRHCLLTRDEHQQLFQNIEKIVCMSEFQVRQIVVNLPNHTPSDDEDDTSITQNSDLTWLVGMIYMTKLPVLCQAYKTYALGLPFAANILTDLESDWEFHNFIMNVPCKGRELQLCDFINRPLSHVRELCGVMEIIQETTVPNTRTSDTFELIAKGLRSCVQQLQDVTEVTSRILSVSASMSSSMFSSVGSGSINTSGNTSGRRQVPVMGSLALKRAHSVQSSTSGFGSGSSAASTASHSSSGYSGPRETEV